MSEPEHLPVMVNEVINGLAIEPDGRYIDCTFGRGGHSQAILSQLSTSRQHDPGKQLLALDQDRAAVSSRNALELSRDPRFEIVQAPFSSLQTIVEQRGWTGKVAGLLIDLGVSSPQLDEAERGFSFIRSGPLDMRMNRDCGVSAAEWLATVEEEQLTTVLKKYGEERFARRISRAIIEQRAEQPITTTEQLAKLIEQAVPRKEKHKHPATRSFQAIRIEINRELDELESVLPQALTALQPGGRLVIIAFHSLEDRIIKRFIRDEARGGDFPADFPVSDEYFHPRLKKVGRAIKAQRCEIEHNVRARSAVLRIAERLAE